MLWENILAFSIVSFMIAISPGASWAYVITMTVHNKRRGGFCAILGNATGIFIHTLIAFLGLAIFIKLIPELFFALKLAGALYLIHIGIKSIRSSGNISLQKNKVSDQSIIIDGIMMNLLNPKVSILMLTLLPQFINIKTDQTQILFLGCLHIIIASGVLSVIVFCTEKLFVNVTNYTVFSRISGIILCAFGAYLAIK